MPVKTAGTWVPLDYAGYGAFTDVDTTARFPLGTRVKVKDVGSTQYGYGELMYCQGIGSTVRGSVAVINDNYLTSLSVADAHGAVGLALAATVANTYGWYQTLGTGVALGTTTIVDGTQAYIDGDAAGTIDDDAVAGDMIIGMIISSTTDTGTCLVTMTVNPVVAQTNA